MLRLARSLSTLAYKHQNIFNLEFFISDHVLVYFLSIQKWVEINLGISVKQVSTNLSPFIDGFVSYKTTDVIPIEFFKSKVYIEILRRFLGDLLLLLFSVCSSSVHYPSTCFWCLCSWDYKVENHMAVSVSYLKEFCTLKNFN